MSDDNGDLWYKRGRRSGVIEGFVMMLVFFVVVMIALMMTGHVQLRDPTIPEAPQWNLFDDGPTEPDATSPGGNPDSAVR